jgi:hypothetical protein
MNNQVNPDYTLKNIIESLAEVISEDETFTDEYLKSINLDPKEIENSEEEFINKIKGQIRFNLATQQLEKFIKIKQSFIFQKDKLTNIAKESIANLLSSGEESAYQSYYRKLDNLSEKDCKEIRDEQAFLNYLDKME